MKEAHVLRQCLDYLHYHPQVAFAWRNNAGMIPTEAGNLVRLSPAGSSDIIGMLIDGRFLAVEVKAGRNKPTELQQDFLERVRADGGVGIVAWGVDDIEAELQRVPGHD